MRPKARRASRVSIAWEVPTATGQRIHAGGRAR